MAAQEASRMQRRRCPTQAHASGSRFWSACGYGCHHGDGAPSPERRRELVQGIATAFVAAPQRSANEINLFDEIMDKVLAEVEPLARRELAERLADLQDAPQRTLVRLAGDEIEVAAPVLPQVEALIARVRPR